MSKEKQIEEMASDIYSLLRSGTMSRATASLLYENAWRKQVEGEWIKDEKSKFEHRYNCPVCNYRLLGIPTNYCPNCGAKMKGGAEQ